MGEPYRDSYQAAMLQLDALRRENQRLEHEISQLREGQATRHPNEILSPAHSSGLAVVGVMFGMVMSIAGLAGALSQRADASWVYHNQIAAHTLAHHADASTIRIEIDPVVSARVTVDGVLRPEARHGRCTIPISSASQLHSLLVEAPGFEPYEATFATHQGHNYQHVELVPLHRDASEQP